ncbi:BREX-2 system phosphatase PglZ [Actinosynnema sp. NPDC002837]
MTATDLDSAIENAVVSRVTDIVEKLDTAGGGVPGRVVIGVRTRREPVWLGPAEGEVRGHPVRYVACPSVLSVLSALAIPPADGSAYEVLVVLTDRDEGELGDAVMARLHREHLHEVSKYTLLQDLLRTRQLDPRLRGRDNAWLVDALVELARAGGLPNTTGLSFGRDVALRHVVRNRLAVDPATLDLGALITAVDDVVTVTRWRELGADERRGITEHLVERLGRAADVVLRLAAARDDVVPELLVADVLTRAPEDDVTAARAFGAFAHSRFGSDEPSRADLGVAASAAVELVSRSDTQRAWQQVRRADALLAQLNAVELAHHSRLLPSGLASRMERAATTLDEADLLAVEEHHGAGDQRPQVRRLRAAVRLRRWLDTSPPDIATVPDALRRHARDLAWVDGELTQVRRGSANPVVAKALGRIVKRAGARRGELDRQFARALPEAAYTRPDGVIAVETLLPEVVAPLARRHKVLLIVVDGMSGAAAAEIARSIEDNPRLGWTEVVRSPDGGREAVLAAFPTETTYSRTSLLTASLTAGTAEHERQAFPGHDFWPPRTRAVLVHKAGIGGSSGADLGTDLDAQFTPRTEPQVVAVVLNTVDDALGRGRQADDPAWGYRDVAHLPELLDRAAEGGWVVVLTSDHGHVLEHGSEHRPDPTGAARWRLPNGEHQPDEVTLTGPRVLVPGGTAVLAATEDVRYGARSHGYHGGAALAEIAIPLVVLLPPGVEELTGWAVHSQGPPDWWTGRQAAPQPKQAAAVKRKTKAPDTQPDLFGDEPAPESRGALLISGETFVNTHKGQPANRVLKPEVFRDVVDAVLAAGGRMPVADVLRAAGTPGRNPRGLVAALGRVLNIDQFPVVDLIDDGRTVVINEKLLDEQFPEGRR